MNDGKKKEEYSAFSECPNQSFGDDDDDDDADGNDEHVTSLGRVTENNPETTRRIFKIIYGYGHSCIYHNSTCG